MEEKNYDEIEELSELVRVAMQIILHAGDARINAEEAVNFAKKKDIYGALKKLDEAQEKIREAHLSQTTIIQNEMAGSKYDSSLLFNHAQDTLMTIMSEVRLTRSIVELYEIVLDNK